MCILSLFYHRRAKDGKKKMKNVDEFSYVLFLCICFIWQKKETSERKERKKKILSAVGLWTA